MKLGPKISEGRRRKRFGKNISKLIPRGDEPNLNFLFSNLITNEMIIDFNMFSVSMKDRIDMQVGSTLIDFNMLSASMKDRIDRQVGSTQIITPKDSYRIRRKMKI
jgi:hypothetical protein